MKFRTITLATVISSLAIVIAFLAFTTLKRDANGQKENPDIAAKLPEVVSKINNLEIINVTLQGAKRQTSAAVIEIKNNSDKSIIGIAIESGNEKDASGITLNGFNEGDEPPTTIL